MNRVILKNTKKKKLNNEIDDRFFVSIKSEVLRGLGIDWKELKINYLNQTDFLSKKKVFVYDKNISDIAFDFETYKDDEDLALEIKENILEYLTKSYNK